VTPLVARNPTVALPRGRTTAVAVGLFVVTAFVFAIACRNGFVNYDDPDYVTNNPHVKAGLGIATFQWAFTARAASNWHPLTWLSHALDVSWFGLSPAGHHLTSVLLHSLNAALAFLALRRLTRAFWLSAVAAACFAIHPLRVESVAWVAERKDVLSGCCFFLTLWAYAGYVEARGPDQNPATPGKAFRWYGLVFACFAAGLLAKPMLVTVPCVLQLLDFWPLGRLRSLGANSTDRAKTLSRLALEKVPLFLLSAASAVVTFVAQKQGGAVSAIPFTLRAANAVVSVPRYLAKIFWPANLCALYPHPGRWAGAAIVASAALSIALSVVAWRWRNRRPWVLVGWLWFLGMLVPVIGLVQVGLQSIADRYTYLPSVGLGIAVLWTLADVLRPRAALALVGVAIALGWSALTIRQIGFWKDSIALFTRAIDVAGAGNYLAYDNRGIAWADVGQPAKAIADYKRALAINPSYPNANNNYALALSREGRLAEAIAHYQTALRQNPGELEIHNNLANALSDAGRVNEAMAEFNYVLDRDPAHTNALNGQAVLLAQRGDLAQAEKQLNRVLTLDPENVGAMTNLGNVHAIAGHREAAVTWFKRALGRRPDDPVVLYNLGQLLLQLGRPAEAAEALGHSVAVRPDNADAHLGYAYALARTSRQSEAIREAEAALQLHPNYAPAMTLLHTLRRAP